MLPGKKYTPDDVLRVLRKRWWMALVPAVLGVLGGLVAVSLMPDQYRSQTVIMITPQRLADGLIGESLRQPLDERLAALQPQILSRPRLERVILEFNLYQKERQQMPLQDVVELMSANISTVPMRGNVFSLGYTSSDARTAKDVTERLGSMFIDENVKNRVLQAESTSEFLQGELATTRKRLEEIEKQRAEFRQRYMGQLPEQVTTNLAMINSTQVRAQSLTDANAADMMRKATIERQIAELSSPMAPGDAPATPGKPLPAYEAGALTMGGTTAEQLAQARDALSQLQLRFTADHPDVRRLKRTIADLQVQLDNESAQRPISPSAARSAAAARPDPRELRLRELRDELNSVTLSIKQREREVARLNATLAQYQGQLQSSPELEKEQMQIERNYQTYRSQYDDLLAKASTAEMSAGVEQRQIGEQFRVIDPARVPDRPDSPNRPRILAMSLFGGLALGVALIGLLEFRNTSFHSADDVVSVLALPVVAAVPAIYTRAERRRRHRRRWLASAGAVMGAVGAVTLIFVKYGL